MLFQRFLDDRSASVVPLLAVAAIPVVGLIGASIDYSRASTARASLQAALDSTVLAMSQSAATDPNLKVDAQNYLDALFTRTDAAKPQIQQISYSSTNGSQVVVQATSSINTQFMRVLNVFGGDLSQIAISATSTATWGNKRLRVALVLDNTGSMTDGGAGTPASPNKIQALQTASHNLLTQLKNAATNPGDVYVSIIPFGKDVNVGSSNSGQAWIDWTAWDAANQSCSKPSFTSQTKCKSNGGTWGPASHATWNGCVTDRDQNYDTTNTAPASGTLFPAEQYSSCPASLIAQSYDWTALNKQVDAMVAAGNTNQAIGLAWGWESLSSGAPLNAPSKDPNYQYQDIIIILSDGLNTQDRWYTSATSIDNRQKKLCDNIKTAGVTIYSIQVDTGSDPTSSVLQYCAGSKPQVADASKFFLLTTPNQIVTTFSQIGTGLSQLRIAN